MVDYRRFLAKSDRLTLPWLGGRRLDARDRRLLLDGPLPPKPGWYTFELKGRRATMLEPAEAPPLEGCERVRGWLRGDRLFREGGAQERVALMPEEEPPAFSPATARRWSDDVLLFEGLEFESEVEGQLRSALPDRTPLREVKGVAAPLRAAYGLALLEGLARERNLPMAPGEVRLSLGEVAEGGVEAGRAVLDALAAERELARRELIELEERRRRALVAGDVEAQREALRQLQARQAVAAFGHQNRRAKGIEERAEEALLAAGARLESLRHLRHGQLEIVFRYRDETFISIVDDVTLQVIDSGICLGHPPRDDLVTLESLIGVIEEAMETGRLVILRWP